MYIKLILVAICAWLLSAPLIAQKTENAQMVYHIPFDKKVDDPAFSLCNVESAYPYYGTQAGNKKDKRELIRYFSENFKSAPNTEKKSGFVVIRFMINCHGETGRFRIQTFDKNYQNFSFNKAIENQLLVQTKNLKDWISGRFEDKLFDSYYYFCFKIQNGKLIDILP